MLTAAASFARGCMYSAATQYWVLVQSTHIVTSDACITVLAAILKPAKAHSVTLLQMSHGGTQLLNNSYNLQQRYSVKPCGRAQRAVST